MRSVSPVPSCLGLIAVAAVAAISATNVGLPGGLVEPPLVPKSDVEIEDYRGRYGGGVEAETGLGNGGGIDMETARNQATGTMGSGKGKKESTVGAGESVPGVMSHGVHQEGKKQSRVGSMKAGTAGVAAKAQDSNGNTEDGVVRTDGDTARTSSDKERVDGSVDDDNNMKAESDDGTAHNNVNSLARDGEAAEGDFKHDPNRGRDQDLSYEYKKKGRDYVVDLKDDNGNFAAKRCQTEQPGDSGCYNADGRSASDRVYATSDRAGNTVIRKGNTVVTSAKCQPVRGSPKDKDGNALNNDCEIGNGVLVASASEPKGEDCLNLYGYGGVDTGFDIEEPLSFNYDHEVTNGGKTKSFVWPSCFDMSGNLVFNNIDTENFGERLSVHYIHEVLPIGKLQCRDQGTCEDREDACHYCQWCSQGMTERLGEGWKNFDSDSLCGINGTRNKIRVKTTVCPPPESFEWAQCTNYKQDKNMYANWNENDRSRADFETKQRFFLGPPNHREISADCRDLMSNALRGIEKARLVGTYLSSDYVATLQKNLIGGFKGNAFDDEQIRKYCIALKTQEWVEKEEKSRYNRVGKYVKYKGLLVGCKRVVVNYEIDGKNRDSNNFLLKSIETTGGIKSLFQPTRNCKGEKQYLEAEEQANKAADEQYLRENPSSSSGGGGLFGNLGNFFGGSGGK